MNKTEFTEQVWKSILGAAPLLELYGYWPSLHDARIRSFDIEYSTKRFNVTFDYSDHPINPYSETHVNTRITLCWEGVSEAKLRLYANDLYGIDFRTVDNGFRTDFEDYAYGLDSYICSQRIEVTGIEPTSDLAEANIQDDEHHRVTISIT